MLMGWHSNAQQRRRSPKYFTGVAAWLEMTRQTLLEADEGEKYRRDDEIGCKFRTRLSTFPSDPSLPPLTEPRVTQTFPRLFSFVSRSQSLSCADLLHSTEWFLIPTWLVNEAHEATTWKTGLNEKCTLGMKNFFFLHHIYKDNVFPFSHRV